MQFFWRLFVLISRVGIMAVFATIFKIEIFLFVGLHWFLMTVWIVLMVRICYAYADRADAFISLIAANS